MFDFWSIDIAAVEIGRGFPEGMKSVIITVRPKAIN